MENLRLESNPWIMPPEAVVEEGLPAVVEYLIDVRTAKEAGADVKELKLLKVVLVGASQAGKTRCLPARLIPFLFCPAMCVTVEVPPCGRDGTVVLRVRLQISDAPHLRLKLYNLTRSQVSRGQKIALNLLSKQSHGLDLRRKQPL